MIFDIFEKNEIFLSTLTPQLIFETKPFWVHGMKFLNMWWIRNLLKSFRIFNCWIIAKVLALFWHDIANSTKWQHWQESIAYYILLERSHCQL